MWVWESKWTKFKSTDSYFLWVFPFNFVPPLQFSHEVGEANGYIKSRQICQKIPPYLQYNETVCGGPGLSLPNNTSDTTGVVVRIE